ncbi:unnamed protein product [Mytilus coruscus]|uniref:Uncharacterized protein n=1 Tax=Mytilus coruscus TaxID=42192 RepID=A0A6J8B0D0_MYTCO|nr:unnamed protein product [Mytilus coruscus]
MLKCQSNRVSLLPKSYSNPPPAVLKLSEPDIPLVEGELSIDMSSFPSALKGEFKWLKHVAENSSVKAKVGTNISWSDYHAAVLPDWKKLPAVSALLPLFHEQAKSVAIIQHSLNIIRSARIIIDSVKYQPGNRSQVKTFQNKEKPTTTRTPVSINIFKIDYRPLLTNVNIVKKTHDKEVYKNTSVHKYFHDCLPFSDNIQLK